jgi:hypothetical protein
VSKVGARSGIAVRFGHCFRKLKPHCASLVSNPWFSSHKDGARSGIDVPFSHCFRKLKPHCASLVSDPWFSSYKDGARSGIRTHTGFNSHKALNLACLPISPPEQRV